MNLPQDALNPRERIRGVLNREQVDRIPIDLWYTAEVAKTLHDHLNVRSDEEMYRRLGLDKMIWIFPWYLEHPEGINWWGSKVKQVDTGMSVYNEIDVPGLIGYETLASLGSYPHWPIPARFDYERAATQAREATRNNYATLGPWVGLFEVYCMMRGLEKSLLDLVDSPDLADAILDRIEACQTEMMQRLFDRAARDLDAVWVSDDMGSQQGLMISMDTWDRFFKDRLKRWCDLIHSYDIKVLYHSDGAIEPLIPRLIEAGIDVLNPIQHACPGMEMAELKRRYGDRLVFHGGVDIQSVLPFGTREEVEEETLHCLETLGENNEGYICCSCHNVQAGTPVANILTMIETVRNH